MLFKVKKKQKEMRDALLTRTGNTPLDSLPVRCESAHSC